MGDDEEEGYGCEGDETYPHPADGYFRHCVLLLRVKEGEGRGEGRKKKRRSERKNQTTKKIHHRATLL